MVEIYLRYEFGLYVGFVIISSYIEEKGKFVLYYLENLEIEKRF